jgi:clan AA aspartic protease
MLQGSVNAYGEPIVRLSLILRGRSVSCSAVIDTGFNGYLSVPRKLVKQSGWHYFGTEDFEIATGESVTQSIYIGRMIFHHARLMVYAVATDANDVLIGTRLLERSTLTINFRTKRVIIR